MVLQQILTFSSVFPQYQQKDSVSLKYSPKQSTVVDLPDPDGRPGRRSERRDKVEKQTVSSLISLSSCTVLKVHILKSYWSVKCVKYKPGKRLPLVQTTVAMCYSFLEIIQDECKNNCYSINMSKRHIRATWTFDVTVHLPQCNWTLAPPPPHLSPPHMDLCFVALFFLMFNDL